MVLAGLALDAKAGIENLADAEVALNGGKQAGGQLLPSFFPDRT